MPVSKDAESKNWLKYCSPVDNNVLLIGYAGNDLIVGRIEGSTKNNPITGILSPGDPRVDTICLEVAPALCALGRAFYGRIVVQVGMTGSHWGYTGECVEAWSR